MHRTFTPFAAFRSLAAASLAGLMAALVWSPGHAPAAPPTWSAFQNAGDTVVEQDGLPLEWSPEKNVAWTAEIPGYGQSTPVVARGLVVVTSTSGDNKDNCHVTAYQLDSGQRRWQLTRPNPSPHENTRMVSRAAPSPLATETGWVASFEGGLVLAIDATGEIRWERNLVQDYGPIEARHGLAASLEQDAERVFVWVERDSNPYLVALDKASGATLWKSEGVGDTSWASPRLVPVAAGSHLVCSASGKLVGLDPETGERLWTFDEIANNTSCTPMPAGEGRFLIGASDGRGRSSAGAAAASNGLIEIREKPEGGFEVGFAWQAQKATCTFGSPVIAGQTAAFVNRAGVLYRLDLETGERVSIDRVAAGGIWATPIVTPDHLYLFGYKGTTAVVSLEDGQTIAENRLWGAEEQSPGFGGGGVLYAAAAAPPYLILRRGDRLFAIAETP